MATSFTILDYRGVDNRKNIYGNKMGLVLLDSGSSSSLIAKKHAKYGKSVKSTETNYTEWETPAGDFRTKEKIIIWDLEHPLLFFLPLFSFVVAVCLLLGHDENSFLKTHDKVISFTTRYSFR